VAVKEAEGVSRRDADENHENEGSAEGRGRRSRPTGPGKRALLLSGPRARFQRIGAMRPEIIRQPRGEKLPPFTARDFTFNEYLFYLLSGPITLYG
jgi:hypothetical protein